MIKFIFLLSLSLLVVVCSDSSINYDEVELDKEFSIKVGESAIMSQQGIIIKFKTVSEDSRCPIDALCKWPGNATVVLELKNSNGDTLTSNLNTSIEPKEVNFSNLITVLKGLTPYPQLDGTINPNDYVARLLVTNKGN